MHLTRETTRDASLPHHSSLKEASTEPKTDIRSNQSCSTGEDESWKTFDNIAAMGLTLRNDEANLISQSVELPSIRPRVGQSTDAEEFTQHAVRPFHKWMRHLHRRARPLDLEDGGDWSEPFPEYTYSSDVDSAASHRKSSSGSSFDLVAAVKSASVSLASASVVTRRKHQNGRSSFYARTERSSRASLSVPRCSEDSTYLDGPLEADPAVTERLLQRRRILEELITTEENYIGDVKFLSNVSVLRLGNALVITDHWCGRSMSPSWRHCRLHIRNCAPQSTGT